MASPFCCAIGTSEKGTIVAIDLTGFALAVLLIELTPGPNMAWLAGLSAVEGRRAGLAAAAGTAVGLTANGVLAALGLATLLQTSPALWDALRWAGAAMMAWLAWDAWRDASIGMVRTDNAGRSPLRYFLAGAGINLLNPKAFIFYVVVAPQFISGTHLTIAQALILTAVSVTIATAIHVAIVLAGDRAHDWLADPARTRTARRVMTIVMLAIALWFVLSTLRP